MNNDFLITYSDLLETTRVLRMLYGLEIAQEFFEFYFVQLTGLKIRDLTDKIKVTRNKQEN